LNIEKARKYLRWIPNTPLKEGLRLTLSWLKNKKYPDVKNKEGAAGASLTPNPAFSK
jgi:dTDP-D-glucose 4,6-dehydratase